MKTRGCLLKLIILLALLVLFVGRVQAQAPGAWVEVLRDGDRVPLVRAADYGCAWADDSPPTINYPGDCGRPANVTNQLLVYAHNWECDAIMCHYSRQMTGVFAWGALQVGDPVALFDGVRLWQGFVIEVIRNAGAVGIQPQDEYPCPRGWVCGVLVTCADLRPAYVVVRVAYRVMRADKPSNWFDIQEARAAARSIFAAFYPDLGRRE